MPEAPQGRKVHTRRAARETAVQALYQLDTEGNSLDMVLQDVQDRCIFTEETEDYVLTAIKAIGADLRSIDGKIIPLLARGWTFSRISKVDRAVLLLAVYELFCLPDLPPKVTINEAVTIAKQYGEPESGRFINGLLGRLSARFGEGAVNGILTSRIGLAAMDVCRPIPSRRPAREALGKLLREVVSFTPKEKADDARNPQSGNPAEP